MVENLKDLEKLLKLCRKQGVTDITLGTIAFKLGEMPHKASGQAEEESQDDPFSEITELPLTPEELTFFANGGLPQDTPYRNEQ